METAGIGIKQKMPIELIVFLVYQGIGLLLGIVWRIFYIKEPMDIGMYLAAMVFWPGILFEMIGSKKI